MLTEAAATFDPQIALLMTRHPITIAPAELVDVATERIKHCHIRHLPVVDSTGGLAGIISIRDVVPADGTMRVADIMTRVVHTAAPSESVATACERMLKHRISGLPVLDGARLGGIFTATDALRHAASMLYTSAPSLRVEQLMTPKPITTIAPTAPLVTAWALMRQARVRHLAVLSDEQLVGILSDRDVLAAGRRWLNDLGHTQEAGAMIVADAMSPRVTTVRADAEANDAAQTLLRKRIGALPVIRGRSLVGMLSVSDFLYWILSWR